MTSPRISWSPGWRSRSAGLLVLAVAAGTLVIGLAGPAKASPCTPWPSCFGAAYQVSGTPDNSLVEWTTSPALGGSIVRSVPNGTTLWVGCQANDGPQEDGEYNAPGVPSQTWDFTWDPGISQYVWVYDWWMNTPPQQAAYNWYSWPDTARHCNFNAPPPGPPPAVTSITAVPTSSGTIHVQWQDNSGGSASYIISNGNVSKPELGFGASSYDWPVSPGTYMCFTVIAHANGLWSSWSPYACTTTPATQWCPSADATKPTCNGTGAFQESCDHIIDPAYTSPCPVSDWKTLPWSPGDGTGYGPDDLTEVQLTAIVAGFRALGDGHAADFLWHYLTNYGTDYTFDAGAAYSQGPGFAKAVNATVHDWVANKVHGDADTFDSGYLDYPGITTPTSDWQSQDWQNAVGHGFYRVVGTRQADGTWSVRLQLTSYYQFRAGEDFTKWGGVVTVVGADVRHLVKIGLAKNFREIGTGTLHYNSAGNPA